MRTLTSAMIIAVSVAACGASFPVPAQRMADAESAERSARELGASNQPQAKLHLKLAQDQIAKAKTQISREENQKADALLIRAKADAELAISLAREQAAKNDLQQAVNAKQGAPK